MENEIPAPSASPPTEPMGLWSRLLGILFSPTKTFRNVVLFPRWLGMLVVICLVSAVFIGGFLSTEVGQEAWIDQARDSARARSSGELSEAQMQSVEKLRPYAGLLGVLQALIGVPLIYLALSGVLFLVFSVVLGATASFRQLFAVVVHAGAVGVVQQLFTWPLNYARGAFDSPTTLASLLPMLEEESFIYKFFRAVDLFIIWWVILLAIGLGVLYKKKPASIALSLFVVYGLIALIIARVS